jgi:hypothetical protein
VLRSALSGRTGNSLVIVRPKTHRTGCVNRRNTISNCFFSEKLHLFCAFSIVSIYYLTMGKSISKELMGFSPNNLLSKDFSTCLNLYSNNFTYLPSNTWGWEESLITSLTPQGLPTPWCKTKICRQKMRALTLFKNTQDVQP